MTYDVPKICFSTFERQNVNQRRSNSAIPSRKMYRLLILVCIVSSLTFVQANESSWISDGNRRLTRGANSEPNEQVRQKVHPGDSGRLTRQTRSESNGRLTRQTHFEDPRTALGLAGIGPSFRNKRDQHDMDLHAIKSEEDALAAAAESVAAGDNAVAAAIETEEARQSIVKHEHSPSHAKVDENEVDDEEYKVSTKQSQPTEHKESENASNNDISETKNKPTEHKESENASNNDIPETKNKDPKPDLTFAAALTSPFSLDRDSHLKKLMSESSDLAKELRMVFDILAKRESQLVEEMENLKTALTGAVAVLKKSEDNSKHEDKSIKRFRREYATAEAPYKACVYIESSQDGLGSSYHQENHLEKSHQVSRGSGYSGRSYQQDYPPEPIVREFIPPDSNVKPSESESNPDGDEESKNTVKTSVAEASQFESAALVQEEASKSESAALVQEEASKSESAALVQEEEEVNDNSSSSVEDVDLSKVYWLKLPNTADDESVRQKVQAVFSKVTGEGKDAIIIPVSRGFSSSEEVSRGFLKAVRVRPAALRSKYFRRLRTLKIREIP